MRLSDFQKSALRMIDWQAWVGEPKPLNIVAEPADRFEEQSDPYLTSAVRLMNGDSADRL